MNADAISAGVLATIFMGAFLDATLVTCFFVFGEVFFIMAGGLAYSTGSALPILAAFSGAYLADNVGYLLGNRIRRQLRRIFWRTRQRRRTYRRVSEALHRRTIAYIAVSRLLGPVAWMTPPLAGSLGVAWRKFALGAVFGVLVGAGQFVAIGWFGALSAKLGGIDVGRFLEHNLWTIIIGANAILAAGALAWRLVRRRDGAVAPRR